MEAFTYAFKNNENIDVAETIQLIFSNGSFATLTGGLGIEHQAQLAVFGTESGTEDFSLELG